MKKSLFSAVIGSLLALLLLAGGSAKEWVHACASHTDTVHHHRSDGQLTFDPQHHHCDFLSYCFPPFEVVAATVPVFHFRPLAYLIHAATLAENPAQFNLFAYTGRGPPASAGSRAAT